MYKINEIPNSNKIRISKIFNFKIKIKSKLKFNSEFHFSNFVINRISNNLSLKEFKLDNLEMLSKLHFTF